jgi:hypothetical protein
MAGVQKSTALKRLNKSITVKPTGKARDVKRWNKSLAKVTTSKVTPKAPLTVAELRKRDATRNYGTAIKVTPSGKVF